MADNHSAFSCAQDPASPNRRAWSYGGAARHGPESCGDQLPICSARSIVDLVNRPQYFPLGFRGDGRRCSVRSFNVRTSLFVGPRLFVVLPQGVQGAQLRRHAQLPASDPCARTWRNFATCRTTSSAVPS